VTHYIPSKATLSLIWKSPLRQLTKNGFTDSSSPGKCLKSNLKLELSRQTHFFYLVCTRTARNCLTLFSHPTFVLLSASLPGCGSRGSLREPGKEHRSAGGWGSSLLGIQKNEKNEKNTGKSEKCEKMRDLSADIQTADSKPVGPRLKGCA
jgi:hypothetical protein